MRGPLSRDYGGTTVCVCEKRGVSEGVCVMVHGLPRGRN